MGKLSGVPDLPPHYLPREADLRSTETKITWRKCQRRYYGADSWAVGVQGMGGIGKTVLAVLVGTRFGDKAKIPSWRLLADQSVKPKLA